MADELQPARRFMALRPDRDLRPPDAHSGAVIAAGGAMIAAGGTLVAFVPPVGLGLVGAGLACAAIGLFLNLRKQKPRSPNSTISQTDPAAKKYRKRTQDYPLSVKFVDIDFHGRGTSAMIAAAHISIENTTKKIIRVTGYRFDYDSEGKPPWEQYATGDEEGQFDADLRARRDMQVNGPSLPLPGWIEPGGRLSGWILESVTRTATGGTPACTVVIFDDMGNSYEARFPAKKPRSYPPKG